MRMRSAKAGKKVGGRDGNSLEELLASRAFRKHSLSELSKNLFYELSANMFCTNTFRLCFAAGSFSLAPP